MKEIVEKKKRKQPTKLKLQILSAGSLGGMFVGSAITFYFQNAIFVFIILLMISIYHLTKLDLY